MSSHPRLELGELLFQPAFGGPIAAGRWQRRVFMREDKAGTRYVLIKRLVRRNESSWTVKQYNPAKTFTLPRKEWSKAHLVIGKYNRAS